MNKQFKKKKLSQAVSKAFNENRVIVYDIECYPNFFSCAYYIPSKDSKGTIEISPRKNQIGKLYKLLENLRDKGWSMVGYNNSNYDWMVLDWIWESQDELEGLTGEGIAGNIYQFNDYWFNTLQKDRDKFFKYRKENSLWQSNYKIPQIDLFKIHRLDAVKIGLKVIQFNLNFPNITTLPHPPGKVLSYSDMDETLEYNLNNDVMGTYAFYKESKNQVNFRIAMSELLHKNFMAASDVKIAEEWFKKELEDNGIETYHYEDGEKIVNQTTYPHGFKLDDVIFDCIKFKSPAFKAVLKWFKEQHIYDTEGVFKNLPKEQVKDLLPFANPDCITPEGGMKKLEIMFGDIPFVFGLGGIHASVEDTYVKSVLGRLLKIIDVESYYPNIIAGIWKVLGERFRVCPEHIGEVFCDITGRVFQERKITPKSDPRNLMYKLIMNAFSFGKLNETSSFVYDPKTCMTITVNGQLMLCMLCEWIIEATNDTRIIQANTDGIALDIPDNEVDIVDGLARKWETVTGLNLEDEIFDWLAVSNVNHYMGQYSMDEINEKPGAVKTKGQYLTKPTWTQDFSTLVIQKSVLEYFKSGTLPEEFIPNHDNPYDFRGRVKVDKRFDLYIFNDANREDESFSKVGVSDCVNFQRIINSNDVPAILDRLNNNEDFIHYIRTDVSQTKKIDYDDVEMKTINSRLKSIPSRAKFLGEVFAGEVGVHDRIGKAFARWWLDRDKNLTMKPMKGKKLQTVTAYYMAKKGFYMFKETLPNEEQPLRGKFTGVQANQKVVPCNNIKDFRFDNIDFDWYINEAWKLITPIMPEKDKHISPIWQAEQEKVRFAEEKIRLAIEKKELAAEKKRLAAQKKLDKMTKKKV